MNEQPPFQFVSLPDARSQTKPRQSGLTMMIDDGLPLGVTQDIVTTAGNYIDLAKIKTGTARLYSRKVLLEKLDTYRKAGIQPFIGGQFHEYVFAVSGEQALPKFYAEAIALGFQAIEISDNVVPLTPQQRSSQIQAAVRAGLVVFGEVGSKETKSQPSLLVEQAEECFASGAVLVLVEAAELVEQGQLIQGTIDLLTRSMDLKKVMIELPGPWINNVRACDIDDIKRQLIYCLGPDVNLANVPPFSIIDTEATRVGLGTAGPPKKQSSKAGSPAR
jgi:phosphosulfolactate synthase